MTFQFKPFDRNADVVKAHRNLPHWFQPGCTLFITFRLADSLSQPDLRVWLEERKVWLSVNPRPWNARQVATYRLRFGERFEAALDAGYGSCILAHAPMREVVESAMRFHDGKRYHLDLFVIMPNHVHVLCQPCPGQSIGRILHSWKSFSAQQINPMLERKGSLWRDENFDHVVRNTGYLENYRRYIRENPAKAGLRAGTYTLSD